MLEFVTETLNIGLFIQVSVVGLFIYWYLTRNFDFWEKQGVPYVKPVPLFGTLLSTQKKPLKDIEIENYLKYGPVYGYFESNRPALSVADPDLIREILSKGFSKFANKRKYTRADEIFNASLAHARGEDWNRIRKIVSPVFTTGKLKKMMFILKECCQTTVNNLKIAAEKGEPFDAKKYFSAFSMDTIASAAFSTKVDSHNDPNNKFVRVAHDTFMKGLRWRFYANVLFPNLTNFLKIAVWPPKGINFFADVALQMIEERKKGLVRNDFLQLLLNSAKEIEAEEKEKENSSNDETEKLGKDMYTKSLSLKEIVAQCVVFFLAGYETASSSLSYTAYELALNPEIQENLIKEIDELLTECEDGELTYEDVQNTKYLDMVLMESMRKYPAGPKLDRKTTQDCKLNNVFIPKDTLVTIPIYPLQNDPKYFPNPDVFDPLRFTPEEIAKRHPYSYLTFGGGPRTCVGLRFATLEMKLIYIYILSSFRIKTCPQTKIPLEFCIGQRLLKCTDVTLVIEKRNDAPCPLAYK